MSIERLAAWVCLVAGLVAAQPAAGAPPPPAEHFVRKPALSNVVISPSGKRLAMIFVMANGHRAAAVLNLPPAGPPKTVAGFDDADVTNLRWVNDDRLVFDVFHPGTRIRENGGGIVAVNHDGSDLKPLVAWRWANWSTGTRIQSRTLPYGWFLLRTLDDGSPDVLMVQRVTDGIGDLVESKVARLNTETLQLTVLSLGMPSGVNQWTFDSKGEPRVIRRMRDGRDRLYLREAGASEWTSFHDVDAHSAAGLNPELFEVDKQLVVASYAGRDTMGHYAYKLKERKLEPEPLAHLEKFDIGPLENDSHTMALVGVHAVTDRPVSVWFNSRLAALQKSVDSALPPGRFNHIMCGRCETTPFYLVRSSSDRHPGEYLLYDHAKRTLTRIGERQPWIVEATQGKRTFHWLTARDGLAFPAVVTHPAGQPADAKLPAVVLVHGGPWHRGSDRRWHAEAQFLASRGWRVIEPDFRGSTGYGWRLFEAGWKQWGLAMQDDLADAVEWAAKEGLIDRERVCIYGGSYGGYAALMGPIRNPGVYRCAASFAGVTDIRLMYNAAHGDISVQHKRYSMPQLIGDPTADAERLKTVSPIERVAEIKVPVLLVQGSLDRRVPREHANKFESAARAAGVAIERVDYGDEGHGWNDPANHADFLQKLEKFLAKSLNR